MPLPALGTAVEIAADLYSDSTLVVLLMKANLDASEGYSKTERLTGAISLARYLAQEGDAKAAQALLDFVCLVAEKAAQRGSELQLRRLQETVRAGGYDLRGEYEPDPDRWAEDGEILVGMRLLPLEEPHVLMSREITALEMDLDRLGLEAARKCYQQGVDSLGDERYMAANAQMRAMLEAVVVYIAQQHGFVSKKQGDGWPAINHLISKDILPRDDGGNFLHGLWQITHTNGSHPGESNAGEARFRVQAMTAAARYLIDRFAPSAAG